jgi:hypothetical protein
VLFALFQLKFAIITPALITGSFAERVRFSSSGWWPLRPRPATSGSGERADRDRIRGDLQLGGALEVEVDARRHARRVSLPRRRRRFESQKIRRLA